MIWELRLLRARVKNTWVEKFWRWIAWHLPRRLVTWCYCRVIAHATTGQYGNTDPSELPVMEAWNRWDLA